MSKEKYITVGITGMTCDEYYPKTSESIVWKFDPEMIFTEKVMWQNSCE